MEHIIIGRNSFNDSDPNAAIQSNISVVNLLRKHGVAIEQMHPAAAGSYFLDFYFAQCKNGGFAQFVWNSRWNKEMTRIIFESLKEIGSAEHFDYFLQKRKLVNGSISGFALNEYLNSDFFINSEVKQKLQDDSFYDIKEDLTSLNSNWIKNHPDLVVAETKEEMYGMLEKILGHPIDRQD